MSLSRGSETSTFLRLCSRAPWMTSLEVTKGSLSGQCKPSNACLLWTSAGGPQALALACRRKPMTSAPADRVAVRRRAPEPGLACTSLDGALRSARSGPRGHARPRARRRGDRARADRRPARSLWSVTGGDGDFNRRVTSQLFDLALVLGVARTRWWRATAPAPPLAATLGRRGRPRARLVDHGGHPRRLGVLALAVHPSPRGAELAARIGSGRARGAGVVDAPSRWLVRLRARQSPIVASAQAVLAIAQSAHGAPFGCAMAGVRRPAVSVRIVVRRPRRPDASVSPRRSARGRHRRGTLLVARCAAKPMPWLVALGAVSAGLGVTYSRAAAIGVAGAVVALVWPRRRRNGEPAAPPMVLAASVHARGHRRDRHHDGRRLVYAGERHRPTCKPPTADARSGP